MMRMGRAGRDVVDSAAKWIGRGVRWAVAMPRVRDYETTATFGAKYAQW
jgi:hypothetical protein